MKLLFSKGHLWDSLGIFGEIDWDTPRQIFTLSLINQTVCRGDFPIVIIRYDFLGYNKHLIQISTLISPQAERGECGIENRHSTAQGFWRCYDFSGARIWVAGKGATGDPAVP